MVHNRVFDAAALALALCMAADTQLNENCTVSVLNRTVQVNPDGSWVLPNIPANFGQVKARATCVQNGLTTFGESAFFSVAANNAVNLPAITLGATTPIPVALSITPSSVPFTAVGQTLQLVVTATYPDNSTKDVTAASFGTGYISSNPAIASISASGLATSVSSGTVVVQATNDGASGIASINVAIGGASHGGIPDSWATANGLDPTDPNLALEDPDRDGLTNLLEFQTGTDPNKQDTDGDGLNDGDEVNRYHTSPLLTDTDGDKIPDGVEVQTGTDALSASSYDLKKATAISTITPPSFQLSTNSLNPVVSVQLNWKVTLIDGKTTLDLTADPRTAYSSSDLTICNFGTQPGLIFAGNGGSCVVSISQNTLTTTAAGGVQSFSPTSLSFIAIPGFANGVAVNGNLAYIASGASGLQIVDVTDRSNPKIAGSLSLPGNANGVRVVGTVAYIAAGTSGLHAVDVSNPLAPVLRGTLTTSGNALGVLVLGSTAYIANGSNLYLADVTNPAAMTRISTLALSGAVQGLDVDPQRNLAVVTAGTPGVYVVDISNPAAPVIRGSVQTGDARSVAIRGNVGFVADYVNSTTAIDLTSPSAPVVISHITNSNLGGFLQDIAVTGNFALGADVKFVNGIPITDTSNPASLQSRAILNFPQRDDNGMGIAADTNFVYLVTEHSTLNRFGATGDSRLYIGQYQQISDNKGIPPDIQITSPVSGTQVIQGSSVTVTANASDDVAVAAVTFYINGQPAFTSTAAPYQYVFSAPGGSTLVLGAAATDFGGNVGNAADVSLTLVPDPLTTVVGRVLYQAQPVYGATAAAFGLSSAATGADGIFSLPGTPTIGGAISVRATVTVNGSTYTGTSAPKPPVPGGTTNVGDINLPQGWLSAPPMPTAREYLATVTSADGRIFAIGGHTWSGSQRIVLNTVEAYNPGTKAWSSLAAMPTARYGLAAAVGKDGKIYVFGGYNGGPRSEVEAYDPIGNTWARVASMPFGRFGLTAVTGSDGRIYAIGGDSSGGGSNLATVTVYTPSTNTWANGTALPAARINPRGVAGIDGTIYVVGGAQTGTITSSVFAYNPAAGSVWITKTPDPVAQYTPGAAILNGRIYLFGGQSTTGVALTDAQYYDLALDAWVSIAPLGIARASLAGTAGLDGTIYALGGDGSSTGQVSSNAVEAFTP